MKSVAIITARGGSKRIPHKNIKPFLGKPILEYSIEAALGADCFQTLSWKYWNLMRESGRSSTRSAVSIRQRLL